MDLKDRATFTASTTKVSSRENVYRSRASTVVWLVGVALTCVLFWLSDIHQQFLATEYIVCSESRNIYTIDDTRPRAECILVKGSTITDVGSFGEIVHKRASYFRDSAIPWLLKAIKPAPKVTHVDSNFIVIPGLADAHAHILENGFMTQLPLAAAHSVQDVVDRIKQYILSHPDILDDPSRWIEGMGWDQTKWPGARFPNASDLDLDPLLKGRPISLSRVDGHARWVSPCVLDLIGDIPVEVEGGLVVRDHDGNPTGIFVDNAMSLIPTPPWSEAQLSQFFDTTIQQALSFGLTSIHDAQTPPDHIRFLKKKAEEGKLPIRLYVMGHVESDEYWGAQIPRLIHHGTHGRLNVRSVKLIADGALGSWGAALLEPYSDKPDTSGIMLTAPRTLSGLVKQFWKDGWQVNIHCIGDRANSAVLDIFEEILLVRGTGCAANVTEWRPRIEHAQILTLHDLERIGRLGVIASVQPTHATSDMAYAESRLGPDRIKGAYAYQTLLKASPNHILPLGSDFPVESVNPLLGFYAAISRLHPDGTSPHGAGGWFPEERLTRAQALKGMTLDAAYASFAEHTLGSLTPGKCADFVVLDRDIMTVPISEILDTRVVATVVDGRVAYGSL